jgi:DNA-directed RNA polymerase subunit RPC12/RpoP
MTIDFTCQKCEGSFELDAEELIEGTAKLHCPHCGNKTSPSMVDDFVAAFGELRTQVANLSKKFAVSIALETEDVEDEIEEEDDEEVEEDEDDELDFDDDDVDDDDDDEYEDEDLEDR